MQEEAAKVVVAQVVAAKVVAAKVVAAMEASTTPRAGGGRPG